MLGHTLIFSGNPKKAEAMLKKAIRLSPKYSIIKFNLGIAYFKLGQYSESITLLSATLQEFPDHLRMHAHLTASYILAGMEDEAHKQADVIKQLDPKFSIDNFADRIPYKNKSDTDRILNALRKAGLE